MERTQIQRGAIFIGSSVENIVGTAIKKVTDSQWMHSGIITDSTYFTTYILSARFGKSKVDLTNLDYYNKIPGYAYKIFNINVSQEKIDLVLRNILNDYLYKKVGYFQVLGYFIQRLFKLKNNPINKDINCSELNTLYLKNLMLDYTGVVNIWQEKLISLEQLFKYFIQNPNYFTLVYEK